MSTDHEPEDPWVLRYKRLMLDHLKAPADVDLSTVEIIPSYTEAWAYSEHTMGSASFDMQVNWKHVNPPKNTRTARTDENGLYDHGVQLSDEEAVEFLRSLTY